MPNASFTLSHSNAPLLAYIFDGFCRIHEKVRHERMEVRQSSFAEHIGTLEDRLLSAALMIAAEAVKHLQPALDAFDKAGGGVFVYEYLEFSEDAGVANCASLPAYLWRVLAQQPSYWLAVSEHLRMDDIPMAKLIDDWQEMVGLT